MSKLTPSVVRAQQEMAECSFQPNPSKSGQKPFEGGKTAGSTYKPWALTDAGQVPDSLGLGDTQQGSGDFELDDDENSGAWLRVFFCVCVPHIILTNFPSFRLLLISCPFAVLHPPIQASPPA